MDERWSHVEIIDGVSNIGPIRNYTSEISLSRRDRMIREIFCDSGYRLLRRRGSGIVDSHPDEQRIGGEKDVLVQRNPVLSDNAHNSRDFKRGENLTVGDSIMFLDARLSRKQQA